MVARSVALELYELPHFKQCGKSTLRGEQISVEHSPSVALESYELPHFKQCGKHSKRGTNQC